MNTDAPIWNTKFKQRLLRVALGVLDSPGLAEEVVQDAYLRFLEDKSDNIENPSHWLFTVTRNLAVDRARRLIRERELLLLLPGLDLPEHLDARHEIENRLADLIAYLIQVSGSHTACIVLLHVVFGVSYEDIANICGRSAAACRQSASRALRKCFTSIDSNLHDEELTEASVFVQAIFDASMTPLIENLRSTSTFNLTGDVVGCSNGCEMGCEICTVNKTGVTRQALVINASGVQWVLIHDGRVLCELGNSAQPDLCGPTYAA